MTNIKNRLFAWSLVLAPVVIAAQGCDKVTEATGVDPQALCCKEFKVGADLSAADLGLSGEIKGTATAFMQGAADFAAAAVGVLDDVTNACQAIAIDSGAKEDSVQETDPQKKVVAWCASAVASLKAVGIGQGMASLKIDFQEPKCQASVSASANCSASCSGSAKCELSPAELSASCESGEVSGKCEGMCSGSCSGSASVAVECTGSCDGTCEGMCSGGAGTGMGASGKCDGKCEGKCKGTCKAEAGAMAKCSGSCSGSCDVKMEAPKCSGTFKPPMGKCEAKAECKGSCDASASAKAECTPPRVAVTADISGMADATAFTRGLAALETHLPKLLVAVVGRGEIFGKIGATMLSLGGQVVANAPALGVKGGICVGLAIGSLEGSFNAAKGGINAAADVNASLGLPSIKIPLSADWPV